MTDLTPVPGKQPTPKTHLDNLSKMELKTAALAYYQRAKNSHQRARIAEEKLAAAVAELELYRASERRSL